MYDNIEAYFEKLFELPKSDKVSKWDKVFKDMAVHTRKRVPVELLLAKRPNEEADIHAYRIANYRAITYGSMNKALDDTQRNISGVSYTITADDNVKEYLNTHVIDQYCHESINETINPKSFIEKITLKRDIEDPNGFLVWFPSGEGTEDSSEKVTPTPKLILCSQYIYSDDFVFIYKDDLVYYFLTKTEIWKMYKVGDDWNQDIIYKHNFEAFPIIVLGGDKNAEGFYESFFAPYLAFGDEAIHQFSDWQAIMTTSSFPHKEVFATECMVRKINKDANNPNTSEEGYSGGGNGEVQLIPYQRGPYGITLRPVPTANDALSDVLDPSIPSTRFISPDIEIARYSGESWEKLIERAEQALNIDTTVGLDQSGLAKQIDKESQYSMISKIGNNFFDNIYLNSLKFIDCYLNRKQFKASKVSISKPKTFWVKSELELITEITQLKANNAPSFFLAEATIDLANKRFNGNPTKQKMFEFISVYDPFFTLTQAEKNNMISAGTLTKEDSIRGSRMFSILNQIAEEKADTFAMMDLKKINEEFEARVKEFFPVEETLLTDENGNVV